MGFYRLLLAYAVAFSHLEYTVAGFNPGEVAVVSFFLLSGYVMTALIDKHYGDLRQVGRFYLDRAMRIYPQFLIYALATIAAVSLFGVHHHWMPYPPSFASDVEQLAILPLDSFARFDAILMPQGWSLGLELMFYAVFPFVLLNDKRMAVALGSAGIFVLAYFGRLNADWFGYRLPPGVIFMFILGSWIYRPDARYGRALIPAAFAIAAALLVGGLTVYPRATVTLDELAGLVIGLPMMLLLRRFGDLGRIDRLAGDLSYGVFLNHVLVMASLTRLFPAAPPLWIAALMIPLCTALSYATFRWGERPIIALRRRLRPSGATGNPVAGRLRVAPA